MAQRLAPTRNARDDGRRRRLLRAARRGDRGARARLVESNLPLVRSIAVRYRGYGLPIEDLVQEGAIGLLDAIDRYDPAGGRLFEPEARFRIRRAIRNALTDQARLIRLPKHVVERRRALDTAEAGLLAASKPATPAALAAATGLSVEAVLTARSVPQSSISLDEPGCLDGPPLVSAVADPRALDPAAEALRGERSASLEHALARLPRRQQRVVQGQWGLDGAAARSAKELGRELNLSPRRTQTLGRQALDALRRELTSTDAS